MTAVVDYPALVTRCLALIEAHTDASDAVAVVSRGDAALTRASDRSVGHFPADADGRWLGYHPADGQHALDLLLGAMQRGASHLLVPATASWWFDHYAQFDRWLDANATVIVDDLHTGRLFALPTTEAQPSVAPAAAAPLTWRPEDDLAERVEWQTRHLQELAVALGASTENVLVAGVDGGLGDRGTHLAVPASLQRLSPTAWRTACARGSAGRLLADRRGLGSLYLLTRPARSR